MNERAHPLHRSREATREILALLDRISRLAGEVLAASELLEPRWVSELLHQHQRCVARTVELMDLLGGLGRECSPEESEAFSLLVAEVDQGVREVQETDECLFRVLSDQRDRVAMALGRSNTAILAHSTYSRAMRLTRPTPVH